MKIVNYKYEDLKSDEAIELAFNKKKADSRKKWLAEYDRNNVLDFNVIRISNCFRTNRYQA